MNSLIRIGVAYLGFSIVFVSLIPSGIGATLYAFILGAFIGLPVSLIWLDWERGYYIKAITIRLLVVLLLDVTYFMLIFYINNIFETIISWITPSKEAYEIVPKLSFYFMIMFPLVTAVISDMIGKSQRREPDQSDKNTH